MIAVPEWVFCALTRALNRCTMSLLPPHKRCWGEALIVQQLKKLNRPENAWSGPLGLYDSNRSFSKHVRGSLDLVRSLPTRNHLRT